MKKVIKKSAIKKKQDGAMLDQVNIDPVRAQQMQRNRKVNEYVLKKAQLVKDQSEFSKTLPEQIGGNRPLTVDELNRKNKFKSDINAYGDSIQMTRKRLTPEQLKAEYEKGRIAGQKRKDKEGSGSGINYRPNTMKEAMGAESAVEEKGIKEGTTCKAGVKSRACQKAAMDKKKNGGPIKKVTKTMKAKKYQAGGIAGGNSKKKAPMVDPKGAFTKVQQRTIAKKKTAVPKKK